MDKEKKELIIKLLSELKKDEFLEILREFCKYCGSKDPRCQCWNDE